MTTYRLIASDGTEGDLTTFSCKPGDIIVVRGHLPMEAHERLKAWFADHAPHNPILNVPSHIEFLRLDVMPPPESLEAFVKRHKTLLSPRSYNRLERGVRGVQGGKLPIMTVQEFLDDLLVHNARTLRHERGVGVGMLNEWREAFKDVHS